MARAKIQDVARLAGVSLSTVSAVINNKSVVSEQTRQRILESIDRLHYRPSLYARNLARRDMRILGVIVSTLQNPFFAETAQSIEDEAERLGYAISLAATNFSTERLRSAVQQMLGARVSGLAIMTSESDKAAFEIITQSGVPCVYLDVGKPGPNSTNIRVDMRGGMIEAVKHLIDLGHRDLLLVRNAPKHSGPALRTHRYRDQGFAAAIRAGGPLKLRTQIVAVDGSGAPAGEEAIASVIGHFPFTAVVAFSDIVALGVYRGLQKRGVDIPREVSVVGFDNTYFSSFLNPPLTTVNIPRDDLSRMVVECLTKPAGSKHRTSSLRLATDLIVRESTALPPAVAERRTHLRAGARDGLAKLVRSAPDGHVSGLSAAE